MKNIPKFKTVCGLFDSKPKWERFKPYVQTALLFAPGTLFGSFGTLSGTLSALDSGLTLAGALDLLENTLFHPESYKGPNTTSYYNLPRLANTMVIFAAWFDTIEEYSPDFWDRLALDAEGWNWLRKECQEEYQQVQILVGEGRKIFRHDEDGRHVLTQLYVILKERTCALSKGLSATADQRIDWNSLPNCAVDKYFEYCDNLEQYDSYWKWVNKQFQNELLERDRPPKASPKPEKLHLAPSTSLNKFRGRQQELAKIEAAFDYSQTVVLRGLGGMGKTELAVEFAKKQPKNVAVYFLTFLNSFYETIATGVISGMSEYENRNLTLAEAFPISWNRLLKCNPTDLLILDNVDVSSESLNSILQELRKLRMRSLLTTRCEADDAIEIGTLLEKELVEIFDDYNAPVSPDDRLQLIRAVHHHTLTVSLIARTLRFGRVKPQVLLTALAHQNLSQIRLPPVASDYPHSKKQEKIYNHLQAVFRVIDMSEPEQQAMRCAVLLPQTGLDGDLFQDSLDDNAADSIYHLSQNGWLNWQHGIITIHPVIRLVCKNELCPSDKNCGAFLNNLWKQYDPTQYDKTKYRQLAKLFGTAADILDDTNGTWTLRTGMLWSKLGDYSTALGYNQQALLIHEKHLPQDHPDLALVYDNLGCTYGCLGFHTKALELKQKALGIREKYKLQLLPDLAISYTHIASSYINMGYHESALEHLQKAQEIQENLKPQNLVALSNTYNNLGVTYINLNDHDKALFFLQKALSLREQTLSPEHPAIASSYSNFAFILATKGFFSQAALYLGKAITIVEHSLPKEHRNLAIYKIGKEKLEYLVSHQEQVFPFDGSFLKDST